MVDKIKSLIVQANHETDISQLIDINMKLCGYMVYWTETESELLKEKLHAYNQRKEFEARYIVESDEGVTKAEKYATIKSKEYREKEISTEVEYSKARSFRSQVNEFTQSLTQKIAHLRKEKEVAGKMA